MNKYIAFVFILLGSFVFSQDFLNSNWKDSFDIVKSKEGNDFQIINDVKFVDLSGDVKTFSPLSRGLNIIKSKRKIFNQNIDVYYAFKNDKLYYGIYDLQFSAETRSKSVSSLIKEYGQPTTMNITDQYEKMAPILNKNDDSFIVFLLFNDIDSYFYSTGKSVLAALIQSNDGTGNENNFFAFEGLRTKVFVETFKKGHLYIIFVENISHLEGSYSSQYNHIIILDNTLYYFTYNPNYNNFSYMAFVTTYPLDKFKVYQYRNSNEGKNGSIYLKVEGIDEKFLFDPVSKKDAQQSIDDIFKFNNKVDENKKKLQSQENIIK